mmetsp:Transcript_1399/g.4974  ORF Transcript_1399/g.4974 Transcript_1399/m.4974 type:complete len:296 (-) Transcript_1399:89-976(-)
MPSGLPPKSMNLSGGGGGVFLPSDTAAACCSMVWKFTESVCAKTRAARGPTRFQQRSRVTKAGCLRMPTAKATPPTSSTEQYARPNFFSVELPLSASPRARAPPLRKSFQPKSKVCNAHDCSASTAATETAASAPSWLLERSRIRRYVRFSGAWRSRATDLAERPTSAQASVSRRHADSTILARALPVWAVAAAPRFLEQSKDSRTGVFRSRRFKILTRPGAERRLFEMFTEKRFFAIDLNDSATATARSSPIPKLDRLRLICPGFICSPKAAWWHAVPRMRGSGTRFVFRQPRM